jgi:hypothetical protein
MKYCELQVAHRWPLSGAYRLDYHEDQSYHLIAVPRWRFSAATHAESAAAPSVARQAADRFRQSPQITQGEQRRREVDRIIGPIRILYVIIGVPSLPTLAVSR